MASIPTSDRHGIKRPPGFVLSEILCGGQQCELVLEEDITRHVMVDLRYNTSVGSRETLLGRMIRLHMSVHARYPWRGDANLFHLCARRPRRDSPSMPSRLHLYPTLSPFFPFFFPFFFFTRAPLISMPDLPVDAGDGPRGKLRRSEGGSDENAFDICFGCCPISARISVFHPSVSHELEAKRKTPPEGPRLSGAPIFWNKSSGHHIRSTNDSMCEADTAFSSFLFLFFFRSPFCRLNRFTVRLYMADDIYNSTRCTCWRFYLRQN